MSRQRTYGFSFSLNRALGISAAKGKIARATGIPTTKSGRQRKVGRLLTQGLFGAALGTAAVSAVLDTRRASGTRSRVRGERLTCAHCPECSGPVTWYQDQDTCGLYCSACDAIAFSTPVTKQDLQEGYIPEDPQCPQCDGPITHYHSSIDQGLYCPECDYIVASYPKEATFEQTSVQVLGAIILGCILLAGLLILLNGIAEWAASLPKFELPLDALTTYIPIAIATLVIGGTLAWAIRFASK